MITEEAPDGPHPAANQGHKRLKLGEDGTFVWQNYVQTLEGEYSLRNGTLTLGEGSADLLEVTEDRLVLIEDLPEIYQRGGPPAKVKLTYRRVSENEFGPMLGDPIARVAPTAGEYAAAYDFRMSKYPTMEIWIGENIHGRARMELAEGGKAHGCFGVASHHSYSRSKYASRDGKNHRDERENYFLLGWRGTWDVTGTKATVRVDQTWRDACEGTDADAVTMGPISLECEGLKQNDELPVATLACRLAEGPSMLHDMAINPADTERSGPYTMQSDPMGHITTDHGRPWLMLGAGGMTVKSQDDRDHTSPRVSFEAAEVDFVESRYIAPLTVEPAR